MIHSKTLVFVGAESRCPICGCQARLMKTALGWMCLICAKRLLGSKN